jgi:uncharacterized membrane protein YhhN
VDEQKENSQMNKFVAVVLAAGSPLYFLVWKDLQWAEIALKVYLVTAIVFGYILLFSERKSLKRRWLWAGMIPLLIVHAVVMYGLVRFNETFPQIDRFPVATYGLLVQVMVVEVVILCFILNRFRPK